MRNGITAHLAVALFLLASCSGGNPGAPAPPAPSEGKTAAIGEGAVPSEVDVPVDVRLLPESAARGVRLNLSPPEALPADGDIEWIVNGIPLATNRSLSLPTDTLHRGDSVQARVTTAGGRVHLSNVVTLANSPPAIRSVKLVPEVIRPGDSPGVEASGIDPDGDEVTFRYAWEKNGEPAGTGSTMEGTLKRNDAVAVTVTPFDGYVRGSFIVLRREVRNYPPSIEGVTEARVDGDTYSCRILASDGDGDSLRYALREGPAGMTIEPDTGTIRWVVPPGTAGKVPVTVSVSDGNGGEASYALAVTVREEDQMERPALKKVTAHP